MSGGVFISSPSGADGSAGIIAGDVIGTFDETPRSGFSFLDGATITDGVTSFPNIAARYPWMVVGNDIVLPDLRGKFPRSWADGSANDPDRTTRTARAGDGATGDVPATNQSFVVESHKHTMKQAISGLSGANIGADGTSVRQTVIETNLTGGSETRPRNIYIAFQMKMG